MSDYLAVDSTYKALTHPDLFKRQRSRDRNAVIFNLVKGADGKQCITTVKRGEFLGTGSWLGRLWRWILIWLGFASISLRKIMNFFSSDEGKAQLKEIFQKHKRFDLRGRMTQVNQLVGKQRPCCCLFAKAPASKFSLTFFDPLEKNRNEEDELGLQSLFHEDEEPQPVIDSGAGGSTNIPPLPAPTRSTPIPPSLPPPGSVPPVSTPPLALPASGDAPEVTVPPADPAGCGIRPPAEEEAPVPSQEGANPPALVPEPVSGNLPPSATADHSESVPES